jgi:hypothetical protein
LEEKKCYEIESFLLIIEWGLCLALYDAPLLLLLPWCPWCEYVRTSFEAPVKVSANYYCLCPVCEMIGGCYFNEISRERWGLIEAFNTSQISHLWKTSNAYAHLTTQFTAAHTSVLLRRENLLIWKPHFHKI